MIEQNFSFEEKIKNEKRRRNQIYIALDYLLSILSYFDFFSFDAFIIAKRSKYLAKIYKESLVTSEFLLLPFIQSSTKISLFLKDFDITEDFFLKLYLSEKSEKNFSFNFFTGIQQLRLNFVSDKKLIDFSHEMNLLFEKASENALLRFKTPVITSDILFITLMEQKNCKASKFLKKALKTETNWYLLRYKIIKHIHYQESSIRSEVSKNQHYFGYLLKTQLNEIEFDRLIKNEILSTGISLFRNTLISNVLEKNLFTLVKKEIEKSIELTNKRKYSS